MRSLLFLKLIHRSSVRAVSPQCVSLRGEPIMNRTSILLHPLLIGMALLFTSANLAAGQDVVVRPKPAPGPIDNPLKGWCPYTNAGVIHQPYSMVFQYASWKELEPTQGDFQFEAWEKSWEVDEAKDKHIIFRVFVDYPSRPSGLPDWLREAGVKESEYEDYGGGKSPDYDDPRMIEAMERLIAALGERYNEDPRIAFIQIGLLGFWGEWHTYPRSDLSPSPETERRVIDAYRKAFPNKSLMVRYARGHAAKQDWIGFHDDMFPEDTDNGEDWSFLAGLRRENRDENWKVAVVGGEMVPGAATKWLGQDYKTTLAMIEESHFSWMGPYCPALTDSHRNLFERRCHEMVRKMGYEFQITQVRHPKTATANRSFQISLSGENSGVAPFYYPWSIEWVLLDSAGKEVAIQKTDWDIRKWKPGSFSNEAELTFDVPSGEYQLAVGIRDPWLDRPSIKFANALPVKQGWIVLSSIKIVQ